MFVCFNAKSSPPPHHSATGSLHLFHLPKMGSGRFTDGIHHPAAEKIANGFRETIVKPPWRFIDQIGCNHLNRQKSFLLPSFIINPDENRSCLHQPFLRTAFSVFRLACISSCSFMHRMSRTVMATTKARLPKHKKIFQCTASS